MTAVYGTAGGYARGVLQRNALRHCAAGAGAGALSLLVLWVDGGPGALGAHGLTSMLAWISVAALVASIAFVYEAWGRSARAAIGATSEERVAAALARTGAAAVVHGALLGAGGDADHVVLGPCAAVVETKTGGGNVTVRGTTITAGSRTLLGSPLSQARRQAQAMRELTGWYTTAIVCIPDMSNRAIHTDNGIVCSLAELPYVLSGLRGVCSTDAAVTVAQNLTRGVAPAHT